MVSRTMRFFEGEVVYYQGGMKKPIECRVREINEEDGILRVELMEKYETERSMIIAGQVIGIMMHEVLQPV